MTLQKIFEAWAGETHPKKIYQFSGVTGSALAYTIAQAFRSLKKSILLILPNPKEAAALQEALEFFLGSADDLFSMPPLGVLPYYGLSPNPDLVAQRMAFLHALQQRRSPFIGLAPLSALLRRLPPRQIFPDYSDYFVVGEELDRENLFKKLVEGGYQNVPMVEDPGTFSRRGGILDIFSPQLSEPARLEFFGDRLETLRHFDPETQRSTTAMEDLVIIPAREIIFNDETLKKASLKFRENANEHGLTKAEREPFLDGLKLRLAPPSLETYLPLFYENTATLFSYLPDGMQLIWVEPEPSRSHYEEILQEAKSAQESCETTERVMNPSQIFLSWEEIKEEIHRRPLWVSQLLGVTESSYAPKIQGQEELTSLIRHAPMGEKMLLPLMERLNQWRQIGVKILLVAGTHSQLLRLEDLLERHAMNFRRLPGKFSEFMTQAAGASAPVLLLEGHLGKGFFWEEEGLAIVTDQEIFGEKQRRRPVPSRPAETFTTFEELHEGDFIVHEEQGVGIYQGLKTLEVNGQPNDFLLLEYLGNDKLYLPVYRLNLISNYRAQEGHVPRLDRMGGTAWDKAKTKVRSALRVMAGELLKLYAQRATLAGYAFSPGGVLYEEFEATFAFEETPDQMRTIQEVNRDMDEGRPMDRLVCGDVGFGKTEVAMRAAFRAILDNKQVAVLVPTTILALQHERNFRSRFQQFPAAIEMLSRFITAKRQRETLEKLKAGKVDIVIGTHALLGRGVHFKDLGLLVVDEEHRFGVSQKEKIKKLKTQADVLTLTATPIPRTLNMSLSGIRDLSVISTPPIDRLSIQTFVANYNEALIREAIHRELARGGQVYFIHNRVQTIQKIGRRLRELIPEAGIEVAHGQMDEKDLEAVMIRFLNREFSVLLCTSIVESGLDIPSANTMIINRADTFGLAQLYQLRGRIGRSKVRAYAYLLIPGSESITPQARSRLAVLQRYTDLGSGFKIAAHDLEIRGAGNLLGAEQSGHIAAVGYDLYMKMMEEVVMEVKGEVKEQAPEPELQLQLAAAIPEEYIPETTMRLTLYKRFASVADEAELEALGEETRDRFGELPPTVKNLLTVMRVKIWAKRAWLKSLRREAKRMVFSFAQNTPVDIEHLSAMIHKEPERFRWLNPRELAMGFKEGKEDAALDSALKFLMNLQISQ